MDARPDTIAPDVSDRPTREEAERAARTLIAWAGEDPDREGVADTPRRLVSSWSELFSGYETDPDALLGRTFEEVLGYDDIVLLRDVAFHSHCQHHALPIFGTAHVAYLPAGRVVGLSKLARVVHAYANRLQMQETLTMQVARTINDALQPRGVAVIVRAEHLCMRMRGLRQPGATTVTSTFLGAFEEDEAQRRRLSDLLALPG